MMVALKMLTMTNSTVIATRTLALRLLLMAMMMMLMMHKRHMVHV